MKIRLVKRRTLESYAQQHPFSRVALKSWGLKVQYADWERPADIQKLFPSADLLGNGSDRVVFNISGNKACNIPLMIFNIKTFRHGRSTLHCYKNCNPV